MSQNSNFKTSICKYAHIGCKQINKCWYAHNKDDLRPRLCINSINCSDKSCCFIHSGQKYNKDEYFLKILMKSDVIGLDKDCIKTKLEYINNKLIIELDLDESEEYDQNEECIDDFYLKLEKMNLEEKSIQEDDTELKKYIDEFCNIWKNTPQKFYEMIDDKKQINLNIKANDLQLQIIQKYLQMMNIEFKIN